MSSLSRSVKLREPILLHMKTSNIRVTKAAGRMALAFVAGFIATATLLTTARAQSAPVNISLNAVVAISANDVWAGGNGTDPNDADNVDPAFEHWDGNQWQIVPAARTLEDQE